MLIDTHCHLDMKPFDNDRHSVIQRAIDAGIEALITVSYDYNSTAKVLKLSENNSFIYAAIGIHPHEAKSVNSSTYTSLKKMCKNKHVLAVGETGLDFHYDNSPRETQKEVFKRHIELSQEIDLPLIIHSREADNDTLRILESLGADKGVFHCFSGNEDIAKAAISMGFYISFAGTVTFKKAVKQREVVKTIPDDYLLIETDAPYLSPVPFRGRRNEPSYIIHTAKLIAQTRDVSIEDIYRITTLNAKKLFNISQIPQNGKITYKIRDSLYINLTNRCTNECIFCVRFQKDFVKGHNLRLSHEPTIKEIVKEIDNPLDYKEIVFCGYGEPLLRLDTIKEVSQWIKQNGGSVRINTNGQGNIINKRNILPELSGVVDSISISLDAHNEETYNNICHPALNHAYTGVIDFIKLSTAHIPDVTVTVVDESRVDIVECKKIAKKLGVNFRLRKLDVVG